MAPSFYKKLTSFLASKVNVCQHQLMIHVDQLEIKKLLCSFVTVQISSSYISVVNLHCKLQFDKEKMQDQMLISF